MGDSARERRPSARRPARWPVDSGRPRVSGCRRRRRCARASIATALAREQGLSEDEVADSFYTGLLMHLGCSALSHETAAAFGDERGDDGASSPGRTWPIRTTSPGRCLPELLRGLSPAERARIEHYTTTEGGEFGRRFDTGSCEVASATARRVGLGPGVQRALREAVEWWNGEGPPRGLARRGDLASGADREGGRGRGSLRPPRRARRGRRGSAAPLGRDPRPGGRRALRREGRPRAGPGARG